MATSLHPLSPDCDSDTEVTSPTPRPLLIDCEGCGVGTSMDLPVYCTQFNSKEGWSRFEGTLEVSLATERPQPEPMIVSVQHKSCCWGGGGIEGEAVFVLQAWLLFDPYMKLDATGCSVPSLPSLPIPIDVFYHHGDCEIRLNVSTSQDVRKGETGCTGTVVVSARVVGSPDPPCVFTGTTDDYVTKIEDQLYLCSGWKAGGIQKCSRVWTIQLPGKYTLIRGVGSY